MDSLYPLSQQATILCIFFLAIVTPIVYFVWRTFLDRKYEIQWPVLGDIESANLREIVEAQWSRDKNQKYILQLPFRQLHVLPNHYVNDYAWKPEHEISSNIDLRERLLGRWTLLGSMTPEAPGDRTHSAIAFIKGPMTKNLATYIFDVHEEVKLAIDSQIGECQDWTERSSYFLSVTTNLRIFERVFVGLDLCRNNQWNAACLGYSTSAIRTASALMKYTWWQRPFVSPFLKETRVLKQHIDALQDLIGPILHGRLEAMKIHDFKRSNDFIQWWVENVREKREDTYALTAALIQLNIAGIQSTGMVLMQALFDLAGRPEYVTPLREELLTVMAEEGVQELTTRSINKLVKMDSFLKESQRHVSQNILSIYRKVMSPLTLKDGTVLPAGTYVCIPSMDPEVDKSTLTREFDGFRWERMRKIPGNENKFLSVTTGLDSLEFGHGSHACPGRFFATAVLKCTLAAILQNYDLRFRKGEGNPVPKYNRILVLTPDVERVVEFRKRRNV